jgi:hypothetical protein
VTRMIGRAAAAFVAAAILALTMASAAMAQPAASTSPGTDGSQPVAQSIQMEPTSGDAVQGYGDCPYGRVCLFYGWNGSEAWAILQNCGWNRHARNVVSSVKTHGNAVRLYDDDAGQYVGYVPPWTQTNLAGWENDRADRAYVVC